MIPAFVSSPSARQMVYYLNLLTPKFGGPKTVFTPVSEFKDSYTCSNFTLDPASSNSLMPAASVTSFNNGTNNPSNKRSYSNNSRLWCHKFRRTGHHTNNCRNNVSFVNHTHVDKGLSENTRANKLLETLILPKFSLQFLTLLLPLLLSLALCCMAPQIIHLK